MALNKKAAASASKLFKNRTAKKVYLAIVKGHVIEETQVITAAIGDHETNPTRREINGPNSKNAETFCEVLERGYFEGIPCTLVKLYPKTGRTHQLRLHMKFIGHPIIGDVTYFDGDNPVPSFRMMLHAYELTLDFSTTSRPGKMKHHFNTTKCQNLFQLLEVYLFGLNCWLNGIQVPSKTLKVSSENPFEHLITKTPDKETQFEPVLKAQRMERFEWAEANLCYKARS
jgi:hypothetical protein